MALYTLRLSRLSALIVLLYIVLFSLTAAKPLQLDNTDFPAVAKRTLDSGVPVYYRGEDDPIASGLYHPPLLIYTLAVWMRVFGWSEASVRVFGMLCALLQGLIVLEILRTLFGSTFWRSAASWFWALFLLCPYGVQTAGIVDIDSTIYGPLLCLAVLVLVRMNWSDGNWRETQPALSDYAALTVILTLCLWAKLTTVFLVFPFVFLLLMSRLGWLRTISVTLSVTVISCALFVVTYWFYGLISGMDIGFTYRFTWESFVSRGTTGRPGLWSKVEDFAHNFRFMYLFMVGWTELLPWIASICALIVSGYRAIRLKDRRALHYFLILLLAFATTIYYCGKVITFGKAPFRYTFVYWGIIVTAPLVLLFSTFDSRNRVVVFKSLSISRRALTIATTLIVLVPLYLGLAPVHDTRIVFFDVFYNSPWHWIPAILFAGAVIGLRNRIELSRASMAFVLLFFIGFNLGIAIYQSKADYATTYDYGQTGFMDTVGFIRSQTDPGDVIACMKDIGLKSGRRFLENYQALYAGQRTSNNLVNAIIDGTVKYAIFTDGIGQDQLTSNRRLEAWINANCNLVRSFGNYRIYQYKNVKASIEK